MKNPVEKCLKTPITKGIVRGRIHIAAEHKIMALAAGSNSWNFGERDRAFDDFIINLENKLPVT